MSPPAHRCRFDVDDVTPSPTVVRQADAGRRQRHARSTHGGSNPRHNRSVVYINMLTVSGGTGSAKAGPLRIGGGGGAGVKVNSRERRAERTLIWVFLVV